jgi:nucleoside-diphosphate-sugar epimerase
LNVLVTGDAGLIGMALRKALAARGHAVTAIDITDFGRGDADLKFLGLEDRAGLEGLGSEQALTMPEIADIARKAVPGAAVRLALGADDVPDVQTAFDVSRIARDLGWRPRLDLSSGLKSYRQAIEAGRAAP